MAIVNKPTGPRLPLSNISLNAPNNPSSTPSQSAIDALKRKFQRVNQEIVKQNVLLQENLARTRQDHHAVLQENVRLKGKIVAIESKLHEAEGVCIDTKKAIRDRIEILEAIGEHLIQVTKFLRVLSIDNDEEDENSDGKGVNASPETKESLLPSVNKKPGNPRRPSMRTIPEEDIRDLTDHISDVSLNDPNHEDVVDKQLTSDCDEFNVPFINANKRKRTPLK